MLVRLQTTGGPGRLDLGDFQFPEPAGQFAAADTLWLAGLPMDAGQEAGGAVECPRAQSGFSYTVSFFDVPPVPASFSGTSRFDAVADPFGAGSASELRFVAPGTGQFEADIAPTQGTIAVLLDSRLGPRTFGASGVFDLGRLEPGIHILLVNAQAGPQARWTIAIRELPIRVTRFAFEKRFLRPGHAVTATYTLSGDVVLTADIVDSTNQVVREVASRVPVQAGQRSLSWDGLNSAGKPVPDGKYRLRLTIEGATTPPPEARITVDTHGPTITYLTPAHLRRTRAAVIRVNDSLSGVGAAVLQVNHRTVAQLRSGTDTILYRPAGGWRPGSYTLSVRATDRAHNASVLTRRFTVA